MSVLAISLAVAAMAAYVLVPGLMICWATPWPVYAKLVASVARLRD